LLWATAARSCGADLTRQCVLDELATITTWTGGGLHARANPADNIPPNCVTVLRMDGTAFVQALPEEQGDFACDPSYVATVDIPATAEAQLDADRISQAFASGCPLPRSERGPGAGTPGPLRAQAHIPSTGGSEQGAQVTARAVIAPTRPPNELTGASRPTRER
jgi:hypothetical protein